MESTEKWIIAGGNSVCRTPPFVYVKDNIIKEVEERFPESKDYKKFYIISTKAYATGDILKIIEIKGDSSRKEAKDFCKYNEANNVFCKFSKVIKSFDGYVEKFWRENYYMKKISESGKRARRNYKKRKKDKFRFYPKQFLILEKTRAPEPEWFKECLNAPINSLIRRRSNKIKRLKNKDINFSYSKNSIAIIDLEFNSSEDYNNYFTYWVLDTLKLDFKKKIGLICLNQKNIKNEDLFFIKKHKSNTTRLIKRFNTYAFKYFEVITTEAYDNGKVIIFIKQVNKLPKKAEDINMEVFLKMIYNKIVTNEHEDSYYKSFLDKKEKKDKTYITSYI